MCKTTSQCVAFALSLAFALGVLNPCINIYKKMSSYSSLFVCVWVQNERLWSWSASWFVRQLYHSSCRSLFYLYIKCGRLLDELQKPFFHLDLTIWIVAMFLTQHLQHDYQHILNKLSFDSLYGVPMHTARGLVIWLNFFSLVHLIDPQPTKTKIDSLKFKANTFTSFLVHYNSYNWNFSFNIKLQRMLLYTWIILALLHPWIWIFIWIFSSILLTQIWHILGFIPCFFTHQVQHDSQHTLNKSSFVSFQSMLVHPIRGLVMRWASFSLMHLIDTHPAITKRY